MRNTSGIELEVRAEHAECIQPRWGWNRLTPHTQGGAALTLGFVIQPLRGWNRLTPHTQGGAALTLSSVI